MSQQEAEIVDQAVEDRVEKFKREISNVASNWLKRHVERYDSGLVEYDYVGSRVGGPEPIELTREQNLQLILSSIKDYGGSRRKT